MVSQINCQPHSRCGLLLIWAVVFVLGGPNVFAAEQSKALTPARYRVFSLRHISAETGRKYLADAAIGTVSTVPGTETLLVTGSQEDLLKVSAIVKLVDAAEQFAVKTVSPAPDLTDTALLKAITARVKDISLGSFRNAPVGTGAKAIIGIHDGKMLVIAPSSSAEQIISAIKDAEQAGAEEKARRINELYSSAEPNRAVASKLKAADVNEVTEQSNKTESDELFNSLLSSLAEAEKRAAGQGGKTEKRSAEVRGLLKATHPQVTEQQEPAPPADVQMEAPAVAEKEGEPNTAVPQEQTVEFKGQENLTESAGGIVKRLSYSPTPIPLGDETIELDLPEKLSIVDLLDLVGKYLNLNYMYDEKQLTGKDVSLRVQGPVKVSELYPMLESVLKFRGFVMTRRDNLVTVVPAEEALKIDPAWLDEKNGAVQYGDVIVTRIFKLAHIDTTSAKNLLDEMKLGADVRDIAATGTLIVTGYAHRMKRIEDLLEMVDKPGEPREFRFRQLKYTMAATLAPKLKTLVEQLGEISITIAKGAAQQPSRTPTARRTPARRTPTPARKPTPTAAAEAAKPTVYLDADERTNRILMIGLEKQLNIVDELIDTLDVQQQELRMLRLYEIQHVDAEDVRSKLQELGMVGASRATTGRTGSSRITAARTPAQQARPTPTPRAATAASAVGGAAELLAEEPQVIVIEATNSLLVNATAEQQMQIVKIIAYVDAETLEKAIPYEIYSLENQDPEDLGAVLNQLIQETVKDKEGKVERVVSRQEDQIIIIPDKNTFSLIVYASKKNQEWIRKLITGLDKRRPQVLIDVALVEITREDLFQYDVSLIANAKDIVTGNIGITGGTLPFSSSIGNELEGGCNLLDSEGANTRQVKGFYGEDRILALLTAIVSKDYGRVLAQPKILVNDNEQGAIKTTDTTYVTRTSSIPVTSGAAGQTTTLIQTQTEFEGYDAGITLDITPHIS